MEILGSVANANFSGNQLGSYVESGYAINAGGLQVQPLGALQYISAWRGGVNETGAGALNLNVAGARADSFRSQLGSRFVYPITTGSGRCILPEAGAYWVHEYAQNNRTEVNQFAGGGPVFAAYGGNLGRDFGLFTTGLSTAVGTSICDGSVLHELRDANGGRQWRHGAGATCVVNRPCPTCRPGFSLERSPMRRPLLIGDRTPSTPDCRPS